MSGVRRNKFAILSKDVSKVVSLAKAAGDLETACLAAVSRQFLLRVPSEGVPLQWDGSHSCVELTSHKATMTLMRRKNSSIPSIIERECCCRTSGKNLCAVHRLHRLQEASQSNQLFCFNARTFVSRIRNYACQANVEHAAELGSHAFRRGMAQYIVSHGGSLAELLRAGGWHYLKEAPLADVAVSQMVIDVSDSDDE